MVGAANAELVIRQIAAAEVASESFMVVISSIIRLYTSRGLRLEYLIYHKIA
jgi:hypothetical protein